MGGAPLPERALRMSSRRFMIKSRSINNGSAARFYCPQPSVRMPIIQRRPELMLQRPKLRIQRQLGRIPRPAERRFEILDDAAALAHDDDAVAEEQGFGEVVGDEDDTAAVAFPHA